MYTVNNNLTIVIMGAQFKKGKKVFASLALAKKWAKGKGITLVASKQTRNTYTATF